MTQVIAAELRALGHRVMRRLAETDNYVTRAYDYRRDRVDKLSYAAAEFLFLGVVATGLNAADIRDELSEAIEAAEAEELTGDELLAAQQHEANRQVWLFARAWDEDQEWTQV